MEIKNLLQMQHLWFDNDSEELIKVRVVGYKMSFMKGEIG